jgi:two-component system CheB/CheR fusion protein
MDTVLQKKVLPLFHYTLNPRGFLFLGTSESIGDFAHEFSVIDSKWKIFKPKAGFAPIGKERVAIPLYGPALEGRKDEGKGAQSEINIRKLAETVILQSYAPPCVLVDEKYDILYFHGETDKYLSLPTGEASFNVLEMARADLHFKLSSALHKAVNQKKSITSKGIQTKHNEQIISFDLVVRPLAEPATGATLMMVTFESNLPVSKPTRQKKPSTDVEPRVTALEQELQSTKEYLQTTIEELETSNEELKSTNEELQSTNEELQSTNEELETSREELQSTNEELETVNSELQNKVDELSDSNDDLNNLLSSTEIGTIFLDNDLLIKRFTPSMKEFFKLIPTDVGRPISDIVHNLQYDSFIEDANKVLRHLGHVEKEIQSGNERWLSVRILPYRTLENAIDGVVITFSDISQQKISLFKAEQALALADGIIQTAREPLMVLDKDLRVMSTNTAFCKTFKVDDEDTKGRFIYDLGNRQWDIPGLRKLLEEILPKNTELENYEVSHDFQQIGFKTLLLNAKQIYHEDVGTQNILLAFEDITEKNINQETKNTHTKK